MPIPRRRFLYLRHGETDWNAEGRAQGLSDVPLNERGRDQARDAARLLATFDIGAVIASPLARARETASIVAEARALPLHEVAFGEREGEVMGAWYEDWLEGRSTPTGGESFDQLAARGAAVLARHLAGDQTAPLLFVAHGALFRAIRRSLGLPINVRLANGAPLECRPEQDAWRIIPLQPSHSVSPL